MRWSLKTLFLIVTALAIFLGWKYSERNREVNGAKRVQQLGGEVTYQWQQPTVAKQAEPVSPAWYSPPRFLVTLSDGTKVLETRTVGYEITKSIVLPVIKCGSSQMPTRRYPNAVWRDNSDVIVEAVRVDAPDVNEEFADALQSFRYLKTVQICRERMYFGWRLADGAPKVYRKEGLEKSGESFEVAMALIQRKFPNLEIVDGIMER